MASGLQNNIEDLHGSEFEHRPKYFVLENYIMNGNALSAFNGSAANERAETISTFDICL